MLEAALLDPALTFRTTATGSVVRSGPFEYRLAGVRVDPATRRLSTLQGRSLPAPLERRLVRLGLTIPPPETETVSGEYLGFRLLARYRESIYRAMKSNRFMTQLPRGVPRGAEARAVRQEIRLRRTVADACTDALRSAPPGTYKDVLTNIERSAVRHARSLPRTAERVRVASDAVDAIARSLTAATAQGPAHFAATLLPLMAGENVHGAAVSDEPCLFDLFRHTPLELVHALKDPSASPFGVDPRGPAEMIAALGSLPAEAVHEMEDLLIGIVQHIDEMYHSCLP